MCQLKKKKIIALIMAITVFFMPMISIYETKQNVNIVHAEGTTVSTTFFRAVLVMMGITAYMQGNMSSTFTIPETDLLALKDQFAQTLEADAVKKSAWMQAQTDYLAGGVAKTMGAVELAKIGVNDIYQDFKEYITNNYFNSKIDQNSKIVINDSLYLQVAGSFANADIDYFKSGVLDFNISTGVDIPSASNKYVGSTSYYTFAKAYKDGILVGDVHINTNSTYYKLWLEPSSDKFVNQQLINFIHSLGITTSNDSRYTDLTTIKYRGNVTNTNLINSTDTTRSIIPTIPWLDTTVPVGIIVTPSIAAPYAGTVPIDVPITAPIDPPIEEPETPSYPDVLSATLAILAALTPISAILDNIDLGIGDLDDVIDAGNTAIADGIDDIINSITGSVTDIGTIVEPITSTLDKIFDPPSKDIDWDKLKNIEIFNKFPFSIPADLYFLMSMLASDPVAPMASIDLDLSFIGAGVITYTYDLSQFDNFAQVLRSVELLAFVFFLLHSTKNLIWK